VRARGRVTQSKLKETRGLNMIDDDEGEVDTSSSTTTTAANDDHIATGVPFSGTTAVASSKVIFELVSLC